MKSNQSFNVGVCKMMHEHATEEEEEEVTVLKQLELVQPEDSRQ